MSDFLSDLHSAKDLIDEERQKIEIELLLEGIYRMYGNDFRDYAYDSICRRITHATKQQGLSTITALLERVLHDPDSMELLLRNLTINVTEMFRTPSLFKKFRTKVVPYLHTYPSIRIWHAGCSTGEEVLSMAILLQEEGLYEKTRIYATDIDQEALEQAQSGRVLIGSMQQYTNNYMMSGGKASFSDYYTVSSGDGNKITFNPSLLEQVIFAGHNLVTDQSFNEFHVIFCRNVMIYFNRNLQKRVHSLFHESLAQFGVLAIGERETIRFSGFEQYYEQISETERLYRKIK
ncbi:CheR family methyltransferase [Paenibacillus radicis (ex Xue et al. 2023)]|uniref:Protein-glutamate O-methyltransferase CheR n=1 Tax=Paenibacillus radicis (ex Xue et al. 2023) TaxID=2972489 RepID=A0ABT1YTK6_9BACL|nr:protein-glutamate O-methyltransferase CheR [Paenibacillus radicis (ex Xue et al. 2023)]MCR8636035.1 protein-glutamate O-methyltransferase CheR [Paenibacillus radicis (ex Xue et al. 2023)]